MRKLISSLLLLIFISLTIYTLNIESRKEDPIINQSAINIIENDEDVLTIAINSKLPGYFTYNGNSYGYIYDLLDEYADYSNKEIKIVSVNTIEEARRLLESSEVDIAVSTSLYEDNNDLQNKFILKDFDENYVVVAPKGVFSGYDKNDTWIDQYHNILKENEVSISTGFNTSRYYDKLLDKISRVSFPGENPLDYILNIKKEDKLLYICDYSNAKLGASLNNNVEIVHEFRQNLKPTLLFTSKDDLDPFNTWYSDFVNTKEFALINKLYKENNFASEITRYGYIKPIKGISRYDDIFKRMAKEYNTDWRLLSAIAYSESRFDPNRTSHRGASGLMQIMPKVARSYDYSVERLNEPEVNIEVAIKLLSEIRKSLRFSKGTSERDRLSIILASYNGGIGHVIDARKLAQKYGANPDSWEDVAIFLQKKSQEKYYNDEDVISGRFIGKETVGYVDKVLSNYDRFCRVSAL